MRPSTSRTGSWSNCGISSGLPFSCTSYSCSPIRALPAGRITFWLVTAPTTSCGERPMAASRAGSMSTITCFWRPPNGAGVASPGTVKSRSRRTFSP